MLQHISRFSLPIPEADVCNVLMSLCEQRCFNEIAQPLQHVCGSHGCICRTGWSALYDESSEEEDQSGLQAEDLPASSLSFQPHNLFKEHFAAGSSAATPAASLDTSLSVPAHDFISTILSQDAAASRDLQHSVGKPRSAAVEAQASTPVELAHQAGSKGKAQAETSYTPRVRRAWGLNAESAVRAEQPNCASSSPRPSQSPAGKPPLPWTAGRGSLLPVGTGKAPRLCSKGTKPLAASQRGQPSGISRSPSASPRLSPGTSKGAQAAQSQSREGLTVTQGTPCTPAVSYHKPTVAIENLQAILHAWPVLLVQSIQKHWAAFSP